MTNSQSQIAPFIKGGSYEHKSIGGRGFRTMTEYYTRVLAGKGIEVLNAFTVEGGAELFKTNPDIKAVVMDACVPGDEPTTLPLVLEFRKTFTGPMIAISGDHEYRRELMEAGCDHQSIKADLPDLLLKLLNMR